MITDLTRERFPAFAEFVRSEGGKGRWLVLTHDNPDPDAIAAAAALRTLLKQAFGRRVTAAYGGIIGRAENQEMVRLLGVRLSHRRHLDFGNYRHFALVDTQPRTGNNQLPHDIVPDLVFDHHPPRQASQRVPVADIRPQYGATATILAEYLLASGLELDKRDATAIVYAVRAETQDFGREFSAADKAVYESALLQVDHRALARIQNPRLPLSYFRNLHQAVESLEGVSTLVISHLDDVEQPDIVPEIADLLLRLEGKTWSLCTGSYDGRVYLSLRTTNPRADAGRLMRRMIGRRGKGGGHGMIAGGWVGLNHRDARSVQRGLAEALARYLKKNPAKIAPIPIAERPPLAAPAAPSAPPAEPAAKPAEATPKPPDHPREAAGG